MKNFTKKILPFVFMLMAMIVYQQAYSGDIVSAGSGNWSATSTWAGGVVPTAGDNVFIENGHTVTVDVDAAIVNLNLGGTAGTRLTINATLQVSGFLRNYINAAPGTDNNTPSATFITSGTSGKLQFIGATRNITTSGQWGANPRNFTCDFALTSGQIGTFGTVFKTGNITITSGIMQCNSDLRAELGAGTETATITVKTGATLKMTNNTNIMRIAYPGAPATGNRIGSLTVDAGGTLEYSSGVGVIGAQAINFNGLVTYASGSAQTLVTKGANNTDAIDPTTYTDLTLQGSAKTLGVNTTVNGTLSMRTSSSAAPSLALGAFTLTYGPSSILQYRGIGANISQTTGAEWPDQGSGLSTPPNIDIFNQYNVTLNGNKEITGDLKLSGASTANAKIFIANYNLSVATVTIPNQGSPAANKYVVTDGTGTLTLPNAVGSDKLFPVGPSTSLYHPATINNAGDAGGTFSVYVASTNPGCAADNSYWVNTTWNITTTATNPNCVLTLDYNGASTGINYTAGTAKIVHCNGASVDYKNGSVSGTVATGTGFTSFSPFGITSDPVVLPVTLSSFNGYKDGSVNVLQWITQTELDNLGFGIERSNDGVSFKQIAFVNSKAANGSSAAILNYTYTDNSPEGTKQYYRLNQKDVAGHAAHSRVVLIQGSKPTSLSIFGVYPNPTASVINVMINAPETAKGSIVVTDVAGRIVLSQNAAIATGRNTISLNVAQLAAGQYFVKLLCNNNCETANAKFVKQ